MSLFMQQAVPDYKDQLDWLAHRVAFNRERGGFHYPSDTRCGKHLAEGCLKLIADKCPTIVKLFKEAGDEWKASITPPTNDSPPTIP
jgi:hypothetical protein